MNINCDVAVVGGGASGMAAAAAAAEAGASVVVVEKNKKVGGNGLFPRGIFAVNSPVQKRKLVNSDADEVFRAAMEYSHWKIDPDLVRSLIDKSGDTIAWLTGKGVEFSDVVHHLPGQTPEVFHITDKDLNAGKAVIKALEDFCAGRGVKILTGCTAKSLHTDASGTVCGLTAVSASEGEIRVAASKVIICTGGFAGNNEMISRYYPGFDPETVTPGHGMRHTGDGVNMALEAGAAIEGNFAMEMAAPKIKGFEPLNLLIGKPWNIWLNRGGRRFADEGIVYNFSMAANACLRQPGAEMWVLFDSRIMDKTLADGRDMIELIHISPDAERRLDDSITKAVESGVLLQSDNLNEIAAFIGCQLQALTETLARYNSFCASGRDAMYAKSRKALLECSSPPYYAVKAGVDMLITHGGIRVDEQFRALGDDFNPVENLYVAGVDFGGVDADVYNVILSGHGFGFALNSGRMAGEYAAAALR